LEGFGSIENTPTGCGSDLPTILRILKNDRKSRSVNNFLQPLDLDPNRIKYLFYQPKLRPADIGYNIQNIYPDLGNLGPNVANGSVFV
jgi:hypothetical protein